MPTWVLSGDLHRFDLVTCSIRYFGSILKGTHEIALACSENYLKRTTPISPYFYLDSRQCFYAQ